MSSGLMWEVSLISVGHRYLINRNNGDIIAWENGRRIDKVFEKLLDSVKSIPIKICNTDNWAAYSKLSPKEYLHIIGKDNT